MTIKELKEMINLMNEHGLSELEVEKNGFKIRLKKGSSGAIVQETIGAVQGHHAAIAMEGAQTTDVQDGTLIHSPMVGTFYAAAAPDAEPYVKIGQQVNEGDVLCIIEAMKLMNEIKSEIRGKVVEILVQNGQPIEFSQPLFRVK